jgi:hypothetical protein
MLERLARLEALLDPISKSIGMVGHNGPPGPIEDPEIPETDINSNEPPLTTRDVEAVRESIREVREQANSGAPDAAVVERGRGVIARAASRLGRWIQKVLKESATAAAVAGVLYCGGVA